MTQEPVRQPEQQPMNFNDVFKLNTIPNANLREAFQLSSDQMKECQELVESAFSKNDSYSEGIKHIYNSEKFGLAVRILAVFMYGRAVEEFQSTLQEGLMMKKMKRMISDGDFDQTEDFKP